jgi:hypothetical protein
MSATAAAAPGDIPAEPGRFKRLMRKAKVKAKRGWTATRQAVVNSVKRTAKFMGRSTKRAAISVWSATKWTANALVTGIGMLLTGAAYLIWFALGLIIALAIIAASLITVVFTTVVGLIVLGISAIADFFAKFVMWPALWLAKGRPGSLKNFVKGRQIRSEARANRVTEKISGWFSGFMGEHITVETDDEAVEDEEADWPDSAFVADIPKPPPSFDLSQFTEKVRKRVQILDDKAKVNAQHAYERPDIEFPGTTWSIPGPDPEGKVDMPADPFDDEETVIAPNFSVLKALDDFQGDMVKFNFQKYHKNPEEVLMAYEYLRDSANAGQERAYWQGRFEALNRYLRLSPRTRDELLDENGRLWGLIYHNLKRQQDRYSLKYVYVGFKDEIADLKKTRTAV